MLTYKMFSDKGERPVNEDSVGAVGNETHVCFALADGLGGHGGGDVASNLVTECALQVFQSRAEVSESCMCQCFEEGQQALLAEQSRRGHRNEMKSTLTLWMTDGQSVRYGYIGDSRIYHFVNGRYVKRTMDHSVPQMLVAAGEITEDQIRGHADRNRLLRVMGTDWDKPKYVISEAFPLQCGEAFLLCSDGFWEWIEETQMEQCLAQSEDAADWLDRMCLEVERNGRNKNMDNYSAVCIRIDE